MMYTNSDDKDQLMHLSGWMLALNPLVLSQIVTGDMLFFFFFFFFSKKKKKKKKRLDFLFESSARQTFHMKCQALFSLKSYDVRSAH